jgi:exopolysaccharide production protein ExoQ
MPPPIALLACVVFVLYLLRLDRKQAPHTSPVLWLPTIWMLLVSSRPLAAWFGIYGENAEAGSPLDRYFHTGLIFLSFIILGQKRFAYSTAFRDNRWLGVLIGYMLLSIIWSDIPFSSFKRWIRELEALLMACVILTEKDPQEAAAALVRRTVYILIPFSLLLIKYFPAYGVVYGRWSGEIVWNGVTLQKNGLGRLCLVASFFLLWSFFNHRQQRKKRADKNQTYAEALVFAMSLWLLKGPSAYAASATAMGSLFAGGAVFLFLLWVRKHQAYRRAKICIGALAGIYCLGVITPLVGGATVGGLTSTLGRDATLTGRTDIWAELLPEAEHRPLLGYGFGGFWTTSRIDAHDVREAHNGYLDLELDLGVLGLLLMALFLLRACRKAQRALTDDFGWAAFVMCFMMMAVVHNITESSFNTFGCQMTATLLFLVLTFGKRVPVVASGQAHTHGLLHVKVPQNDTTTMHPGSCVSNTEEKCKKTDILITS